MCHERIKERLETDMEKAWKDGDKKRLKRIIKMLFGEKEKNSKKPID